MPTATRRSVFTVLVALATGLSVVMAQRQTPMTPEELREDTTAGARLNRGGGVVPLPRVDGATSHDWPLNNHDLANSRYAPLDQINASNVGSLAVRWLYHGGSGRATPVVANGVMYLTTSESVIALDAATGRTVWSNTRASGSRGAVYGNGVIYVANDVRVMALDATTRPVSSSRILARGASPVF